MLMKYKIALLLSILSCGGIGFLLFRYWTSLPLTSYTVPQNLPSIESVSPPSSVSAPRNKVQNTDSISASETEKNFTWQVGGPTPEGPLLFAKWRPDELGANIYVLSDYGFMLLNEGSHERPKAVYLLGFLKQKKIKVFRAFADFAAALKEIPRGTKVYCHTVCTAGTAPGIGEKISNQVERAFHRAGLKYNEEDHVMYCAGGEFADPYPSVPRALKVNFVRLYGAAAWKAHSSGEE